MASSVHSWICLINTSIHTIAKSVKGFLHVCIMNIKYNINIKTGKRANTDKDVLVAEVEHVQICKDYLHRWYTWLPQKVKFIQPVQQGQQWEANGFTAILQKEKIGTLLYPILILQASSNEIVVTLVSRGIYTMQVAIYIYNSVRFLVCLFIHDSGKNYCTRHHQTLRDYEVGLQKCPPWVEIAHLAVLEEISFHFRFFVHGWQPFY